MLRLPLASWDPMGSSWGNVGGLNGSKCIPQLHRVCGVCIPPSGVLYPDMHNIVSHLSLGVFLSIQTCHRKQDNSGESDFLGTPYIIVLFYHGFPPLMSPAPLVSSMMVGKLLQIYFAVCSDAAGS